MKTRVWYISTPIAVNEYQKTGADTQLTMFSYSNVLKEVRIFNKLFNIAAESLEFFIAVAKSKIEYGEKKLLTKRQFLKKWDNYAYKLSTNAKIIEAYASVDNWIEKGMSVQNPYISKLMPQTINFRHNTRDSVKMVKDYKVDEKQKTDDQKGKTTWSLSRHVNKSSRVLLSKDEESKANVALKAFAHTKILIQSKSTIA
jgi:hypothetical protein